MIRNSYIIQLILHYSCYIRICYITAVTLIWSIHVCLGISIHYDNNCGLK